MLYRPCISRVAAIVALFAVSASASAALIPWNGVAPELGPSGTASFFTWSNGGTDTALLGNPTLKNGGTFEFLPESFFADGGVADTAYDRAEVNLAVIPGYDYEFLSIRVVEWGTYDSVVNGSVSAQLVEQVTRLIPLEMKNVSDTFAFDGVGEGEWSLATEFQLPLAGGWSNTWTQLTLVVENTLQATGGSTIVKEGMQIIITPEPLAFVPLAALGLLLLRRR